MILLGERGEDHNIHNLITSMYTPTVIKVIKNLHIHLLTYHIKIVSSISWFKRYFGYRKKTVKHYDKKFFFR